ncbi:MAG: von Willebrand factor type A domain-containing protein [Hymenobacter sp.]
MRSPSCHQTYEKTEALTAPYEAQMDKQTSSPSQPEAPLGDTYATIQENAFRAVAQEPLSTFALDVDNASYTNVRRFLQEGQLPPRDAVRVEELLNYFHYELPAPAADSPDPVRISTELSDCPWAAGHQLARIGNSS